MYDIDTALLLNAMQYYKDEGFNPTSSPLLVTDQAVNFTLPKNAKAKKHLDLNYVGSAEQSFYQLLIDDPKLSGDFMLISPCQRYDTPSETHLNIFLKLELISTIKTREELLQTALDFYSENLDLNLNIKPDIVETSEGFDININGVEVGSFGSRFILNRWISYGTGLALPRISYALSRENK